MPTMKQLHFSTDINAPRETVWNVLWNDATYRDWTSVFAEGSYAVSDWNEGSKIQFDRSRQPRRHVRRHRAEAAA
jgi:hypothetical protein